MGKRTKRPGLSTRSGSGSSFPSSSSRLWSVIAAWFIFNSSSAISKSPLSHESEVESEEELLADTLRSVSGVDTSILFVFNGVSNCVVTVLLSMVRIGILVQSFLESMMK